VDQVHGRDARVHGSFIKRVSLNQGSTTRILYRERVWVRYNLDRWITDGQSTATPARWGGVTWAAKISLVLRSELYGARQRWVSCLKLCGWQREPYPRVLDGRHGSSAASGGGGSSSSSRVIVRQFQGISDLQKWHAVVAYSGQACRLLQFARGSSGTQVQ
jgi:hypothetical protein